MSFTILIVDDEENTRLPIKTYLTDKGYEVIEAGTLNQARSFINRGIGDVVLMDKQLPDGNGLNLLYETATMPVRPPFIMITGYGTIVDAVDAMKNGALDFITKPIDLSDLELVIQRAVEIVGMRRELALYRQTQQQGMHFVAGNSAVMQSILQLAQRAANASVSVLVTGETGTGKEVLAKYIHSVGPRSGKPKVDINCAAIQPTMLESELFGYEAGAFTSAEKRKIGLMEVADGGILFLDEISSMPLDIQAKLLRAIEDKNFRRVGGTHVIDVDLQIVAASNRDLNTMIEKDQFRSDLYYRLKVVDIHLPPLRERKEDIPELVGFFIRENNPHFGSNITDLTPRAMQALVDYAWPGNIRQLKNCIERAMLFCDTGVIDL
ncbi:MAG TPA: sigma-54 dependent transcriptional regulator, partial [Longilinea sp.]|nr:sigma-54 dependent transcriptional regulator [Longilinea sp.]